jgi:L-lactate utilization protein LutB
MAFDTVRANLEKNGYTVGVFATAAEAARHIAAGMNNETVGFGGSITLQDMGLHETLSENNTVIWHWKDPKNRDRFAEFTAYVTSVNALAETGEMVNIDGTGNRLAASLYGPKRVCFVIGRNKLTPDLPSAITRARNIASPVNAKRLGKKTPCAATGTCHDCNSPDRICGALCVYMRPMAGMERTEVILVDEDLGF